MEAGKPVEAEKSGLYVMRPGIILFIISEAFLFGSLFWTYYYLRAWTPGWPPEHPDPVLASINTVVLLPSSYYISRAVSAIQRGNTKGLATWLVVTLSAGVIFLGITVFEWTHESFVPSTNAYGSIFFTLTGFHALHVFGGVLLMAALLNRTLKQRFSAERHVGVEIGSYYWHFVDLVWVFVFATIFIIR